MACRARVTSEVLYSYGVRNFCRFLQRLSSAVHMLVEEFVAKCYSVPMCKMSMCAKSAQDPIMQGRHVLRWSCWYGAALDILHLLDSSAPGNALPLPDLNRPFPSTDVASRFVVSYIACAHTQVSSVACRSLSRVRKPVIHVVECCSALHVQAVLTGPWLLVS